MAGLVLGPSLLIARAACSPGSRPLGLIVPGVSSCCCSGCSRLSWRLLFHIKTSFLDPQRRRRLRVLGFLTFDPAFPAASENITGDWTFRRSPNRLQWCHADCRTMPRQIRLVCTASSFGADPRQAVPALWNGLDVDEPLEVCRAHRGRRDNHPSSCRASEVLAAASPGCAALSGKLADDMSRRSAEAR